MMFMRAAGAGKHWVRLDGLASASDTINEYRKLVGVRRNSGDAVDKPGCIWSTIFIAVILAGDALERKVSVYLTY